MERLDPKTNTQSSIYNSEVPDKLSNSKSLTCPKLRCRSDDKSNILFHLSILSLFLCHQFTEPWARPLPNQHAAKSAKAPVQINATGCRVFPDVFWMSGVTCHKFWGGREKYRKTVQGASFAHQASLLLTCKTRKNVEKQVAGK